MWDKASLIPKKQSWPHKLAFQELSPKERAAFILRYQQHYPQAQIATMLGLSPGQLNQLFDNVFLKISLNTKTQF